ncbi:MAG: ABC transporter ATP-binding protein [Desulfurococcales archaeon]|nr:ABC transporter ATP-binding protein [Desulfurococcales archaeon]
MAGVILAVEGVTVYYGKIRALEDVSVETSEGEISAIIGRNGAGKTTLIKAVIGLVDLRSGRILFKGKDITGLPPWERAKIGIGYVPEGRRLFPDLTVEENLLVSALYIDKSEIPDRLEEVYSLFPRLRERRRQKARTLSGGEAQMLAIARGLMSKPRIILMDEPSQGLAPIIVERLFEAIKGLKMEGYSILLVEQNAKKALEVADKVYVLETGRIVLEAPVDEALNNPMIRKAYLGV